MKSFSDRDFARFTFFTLAVFATLDSSYPAATSILVAAFATCTSIRKVFRLGDNNNYQEQLNFFFTKVKPYDSEFISYLASLMGLVYIAVVDNMPFEYAFMHWLTCGELSQSSF